MEVEDWRGEDEGGGGEKGREAAVMVMGVTLVVPQGGCHTS